MANTFHDGPYTRLPADEQSAVQFDGTTTTVPTCSCTSLSTTFLTVLGASIIFSGSLPTSDPSVAGKLYLSSGALKVSAG